MGDNTYDASSLLDGVGKPAYVLARTYNLASKLFTFDFGGVALYDYDQYCTAFMDIMDSTDTYESLYSAASDLHKHLTTAGEAYSDIAEFGNNYIDQFKEIMMIPEGNVSDIILVYSEYGNNISDMFDVLGNAYKGANSLSLYAKAVEYCILQSDTIKKNNNTVYCHH